MDRADRVDQVDRVDIMHGNMVPSVHNNGNTPRSVSISIGYGTEVALVQKNLASMSGFAEK